MKEEKMMILSMLEEGKITSEEAIKLLDALEEQELSREYSEDHNEFTKESSQDTSHGRNTSKPRFNNLGDIGIDIGNVLSDVFNGLKDISVPFNFRGNYETITTDLDMDLSHIESPSIDLRAINGNIYIRPTSSGDKVLIKSTCQYKNGILSPDEPYFDFYMNGNKLVFNPRYNSSISIKLEVSIPEKQYNEIVLTTSNGKIDIQNLKADTIKSITTNSSIYVAEVDAKELDLSTKNSKIECSNTNSNILNATTSNSNINLMKVNSKEVYAKTSNSKITVYDIDAGKITLKTSNSPVEVDRTTCDLLNITTSNSKINLDNLDLERVRELKLITSNGSINSRVYTLNKEVYFDLETSMGSISLETPNLVYKINKQANLGFRKIVAHSTNYDENNEHLKFFASTSNGSIKIY